jgi:hypothetical protein
MSQTFTAFTGSTDLGDTPTIINANFDAIRSNWAGTSAPGSPVVGQPFYNITTGKITIWDGASWVDSANTSTTVLANTAELLAARGTAANLNARLSVAMNPDGTLKDTLPVGDWWMDEGDIVEYVSSSSFTVEGDKTAIYIENRALYLIQTTSEYNYVVSSSYSSGTDLTTVTTLNENVDSGLSSVQYGQPVENAPVVTVESIGAEPADADIVKAPGGILPPLNGAALTGIRTVSSYVNLAITAEGLDATVDISADEMIVKTAAGLAQLLTNVSLSGDLSTSGANGLDAGTVAADTWYAVHVIYNPTTNTTAALLSLSSSAPTLPSGYTHYLRVGWVLTDSTNAYPLSMIQRNSRAQWAVDSGSNLTAYPTIASGVSGSTSIPTYVAASVLTAVPETATQVRLMAAITATDANTLIIISPNNSTGAFGSTSNPPYMSFSNTVNGGTSNIPFDMVLESSNIYWACNKEDVTLRVHGWEDAI